MDKLGERSEYPGYPEILPIPVQTDCCPSCGTTRRDLDVDGRMGCAECYRVFEAEVLHALQEIHGAVQHIGKTN